jgi:hypothetical protein
MYIKMIEATKIDPLKLRALKASLPHGAITRIANELSLTPHSVDKVFKGRWDNEQVINRAVEILEEAKAKKVEREALIDRALKNI